MSEQEARDPCCEAELPATHTERPSYTNVTVLYYQSIAGLTDYSHAKPSTKVPVSSGTTRHSICYTQPPIDIVTCAI